MRDSEKLNANDTNMMKLHERDGETASKGTNVASGGILLLIWIFKRRARGKPAIELRVSKNSIIKSFLVAGLLKQF